MRRRDRLLGRSARRLRRSARSGTWPTTSPPTWSSSAPAFPGRSWRQNSPRPGVKVAILEAGAKVDRQQAVERYWDALDQGAGMPLSAGAAGDAPDLRRSRLLVQPDRPRQVREHLPQGGRRHDLALARHLPPARPQRFPPEKRLRAGRRLADLLRRPRAVLRRRRERDRRLRGFGERPRRAADQALSDAGHPADLSRQGLSEGARRHRLRGALDARGAELGRCASDRPACCGNASCIPVCPVQAKYDATVHVDRAVAAGRDAPRPDDGGLRRGRGRPARSRPSASSAGTAARAGRPARSSSSPRTRSRRRASSSTRFPRRRRTASPIAPTRSGGI